MGLAVAATVVLVATPAQALEGVGGVAPSSGESHCVMAVLEQKPDGEFVTGGETCFNMFSQAVGFASGGSIRLPADTPGTVNNYAGGASMLRSSTLAMHFDGYYGTGSSIIITGSRCSGYWNTSSNWDNRISSTYNVCFKTRHYDYPYLRGSWATLSGPLATHNLPWSMNNKTESVRYLLN